MSTILIIQAAALLILMGFSAFFSSAETALFALSPMQIHKIRRSKPRQARAIEDILASPTHLLSTLLIGNTLVNVAEKLAPSHGAAIAIPVMTVLLIIFGEVTPKRIAVRYADNLAVIYLKPVQMMIWLFIPGRMALDWLTMKFEDSFKPRRPALTGEELLTAVDMSHETGALNRDERLMVDGILRLETIQARDVMTPRVDLIGINLNDDPATFSGIARNSRFNYLPVYKGSLDQIVGFLDVPKFLLETGSDIKAATLPHYYVPDTAPLDSLLTSFQQQNRRIAVVIDEYGGTAGMITRGDILDKIVEFAYSAADGKSERIKPAGESRWLVDGATSLEEVNYELDLHLDGEGADRIAGWFTAQTHHIPRVGEGVEAQGCRATVQDVRKHRITTLLIEKLPQTAEVHS